LKIKNIDSEWEIIECTLSEMIIDGSLTEVYRFKFRLYDYYMDGEYRIIGIGNYFESKLNSYIIENYDRGLD
jgi:hypothetical protein